MKSERVISPIAVLAVLILAACGGRGAAPPVASGASSEGAMQSIAATQASSPGRQFNEPGNILIADQFNNRVIEIDPPSHAIVWQYRGALGTNDAERVGALTLIAGTGVPPANPPFEPGCVSGCPDNRVMLVDELDRIVWEYGKLGVTGSGPDQLNTPVQATALPNGNIIITDQGNQRVIEITRHKNIVFQYGMTGVVGNGFNQLSNPNSAELLPSGTVLIADENNNRVIEVNANDKILWQYPTTPDTSKLNGAAFASRLNNGNTLITDSNNNRIIEIDRNKNVVWTYSTLAMGGNSNPLPTRAVRMSNGDTLISDQFNDRVIQVRKTGPNSGMIVFTQGTLNDIGRDFDELNGPYDAKVVGDYTGLTHP